MAVMKATEINDILNLTADTARNDAFTRLILLVQSDACEYMNNYFADPIVYRDGDLALEFVRGDTGVGSTADYITDTDEGLSSAGFSTAFEYDIVVEGGGGYNAGIHHVKSLTAAGNKFTLDSTGVLYPVDMDDMENWVGGCRISLVSWPAAIKPYIAQMVWHRYNKPQPSGALSERIDDYSITYAGGYAYPSEAVEGLDKWRKAVLV